MCSELSKLPFFVINLPRSKKRRHHVKSLLQRFKLEYQFIEAVDGKKLSKTELDRVYDQALALKHTGRHLTKEEIALCLSHRKVFELIVKEKLPHAFILEDDIKIHDHFLPLLSKTLQLKEEYELILFAHGDSRAKGSQFFTFSFWGRRHLLKGYSLVRFCEKAQGALGFLLTQKAAQKLLQQLSPPKLIFQPADCYTGAPTLVNLYGVYPPPIEEASIGARSTLNHRKWPPKTGVMLLRHKLFEWLQKKKAHKLISLYFFIKSLPRRIRPFPLPED